MRPEGNLTVRTREEPTALPAPGLGEVWRSGGARKSGRPENWNAPLHPWLQRRQRLTKCEPGRPEGRRAHCTRAERKGNA